MVTIHHLNNSRAQRILWLLEELGVDYDVKYYFRPTQIENRMEMTPLRAVHPLGKSPVITDGDVTLAESGAIVEYLVERYNRGQLPVPEIGTPERIQYLYWMHYAEGTLMPFLFIKFICEGITTSKAPFFVRPILKGIGGKMEEGMVLPQLKLQFDYMEQILSEREWFTGNRFTAADLHMGFPLELAQQRANLDQRWPQIMNYLQRIRARPAYQRAMVRDSAPEKK